MEDPLNKAPEVDKALVNPLDQNNQQAAAESSIIKNIVSSETSLGEASILGAAPELDTSLLEEFAPKKSMLLFILKGFFAFLVIGSIASVLFFNSQLTSNFDFINTKLGIPSVIKDLTSTNAEVIGLQTDINLFRYLQIKSFLDKFSYDGDSFIRNFETSQSQTVSSGEQAQAKTELEGLRNQLSESFSAAKELLSKDTYVPIIDKEYADDVLVQLLFQEKLKTKLLDKATTLTDGQDTQTRRDYKNYMNAANFVGNAALKSLMIQKDFPSLSDLEIYELIKQVDSIIVNEMSTIQKIKNQRIKWSDIINEIELKTKAIDSHYSKDYYETVGGIRYTSFDFDTNNRKISIIGETKTINTATFTMIADLIDKLNGSEFFENGEMRSFSKSGSLSEGYTGSLKLTLDLQQNVLVTDKSTSDITETPDFLNN